MKQKQSMGLGAENNQRSMKKICDQTLQEKKKKKKRAKADLKPEESGRLRTIVKGTPKILSLLQSTTTTDYGPELSHLKQRLHINYQENPLVNHFPIMAMEGDNFMDEVI